MNHQIEKARNIGLEILRPGLVRVFFIGMQVCRHKRLAGMDEGRGANRRRRRRSYRGNGPMFQVGRGEANFSKKKRTGWEGSRRSAGLRGKDPIRLAARGLGG
jgi:hypothetical protein